MEHIINKILEELEDRYRVDKRYLPYIEAQNTILHYGPRILRAAVGWKDASKEYPEVGEKVILVLSAQDVVVGFWDGEKWATSEGTSVTPEYWGYCPI